MATFLSALSLVILVLANSCFTLPVLNEDLTTISALNDQITVESVSNVRLASGHNTAEVPTRPLQGPSGENLGFEQTTIADHQFAENTTRVPRIHDELTAKEGDLHAATFTTERLQQLTTERMNQDKRQFSIHSLKSNPGLQLTTQGFARSQQDQDNSLAVPVESVDLTTERFAEDKGGLGTPLSDTVKSFQLTTERSVADKRELSAVLYNIVEPLLIATERAGLNESSPASSSSITVEPVALTTERSAAHKHGLGTPLSETVKSFQFTTEGSVHHKRGQDSSSSISVEPLALTTERSIAHKHGLGTPLSETVKSFQFTTERAMINGRNPDSSSSITVEPVALTTEKAAQSEREFNSVLYDIVEPLLLTTERALNVDTDPMHASSSTKKSIAQGDQIQKRKIESESTVENLVVPSTSSSKSASRFENNNGQVEKQERPRKPLTPQRKLRTSSTTTPRDYSSQFDGSSSVPTAVFDQDASKKISNVPSDFLILDETVEVIVTDLPERLSSSTMKHTTEAKPLNQGQESSNVEEKKSNH